MKKLSISMARVAALGTVFSFCGVTSQLGITTAAATRIIDIIDVGSDVLTIISLIGVVAGVGALSYGFVVAAKAMIKKVGKALAIAW